MLPFNNQDLNRVLNSPFPLLEKLEYYAFRVLSAFLFLLHLFLYYWTSSLWFLGTSFTLPFLHFLMDLFYFHSMRTFYRTWVHVAVHIVFIGITLLMLDKYVAGVASAILGVTLIIVIRLGYGKSFFSEDRSQCNGHIV